MPGMKGFDAPPFLLHYDEMPALDGANLRHVRAQARELFLPLFLSATDRTTLLNLKRRLLSSFNPSYGAGQIRVTEQDGSSRWIEVYYASGAEGDEGKSQAGVYWCKYGLVLRAFDPFFYAGSSQVVEFTPGALSLKKFFSEPFLGLHLNSSANINGTSEVTITGDVDTWPVWHVQGPGNNLTFKRSVSTGPDLTFSLGISLGPTDAVVIDTRPGRKSVRHKTTGESFWSRLGPNPQLWPIAPGRNQVTITMSDVGAETSVVMLYQPRYISA